MENNKILITPEELKTNGFINSNIDVEYIIPAIEESQDVFLREILGDSLLNKLIELNEAEQLSEKYEELVESYVKHYLKYKTLGILVMNVNFKVRNAGLIQQFGNEMNSVGMEETKYYSNWVESKVEFYENRLTAFLQKNRKFFPEYNSCCEQITSPSEGTYSSIYLGNGKRRVGFVSGSGSGSTGGGGSSEAVWGKIKGNISDQLDLQNELTIKVNRSELARVATSGSYNDLSDKPTIPTKTSELTNDSGYLTEHQSIKTINGESLIGNGNLEIEGFSGDYNDLTNKPTIPNKTSELTNDSGFLTEHQPLKTINNESIVGEGNIEIEGGSGRNIWYGNQAQFDSIPENELDQETDYYISGLIPWDDIDHPYIPTKTSDLNNDANFTSESEVSSEIIRSIKVFEKRVQYVSQAEFDSMEQAGTLKDGVTYFIEGEYVIPTKTSELTNDSGFLTEHQSIKTINNESIVGTGNLEISGFSGDYNDLTNKPYVPGTTIEMEVEFEDGTSTTYNVYIQ